MKKGRPRKAIQVPLTVKPVDRLKETETRNQKRPMLTDPDEFNIIRAIHFDDHSPAGSDLDPGERLERQVQGKHRNQSR